MNLYIMAGALRVKKPIPKYLPSAAMARKRLLDQMEESELETEEIRQRRPPEMETEKHRRWADVYRELFLLLTLLSVYVILELIPCGRICVLFSVN